MFNSRAKGLSLLYSKQPVLNNTAGHNVRTVVAQNFCSEPRITKLFVCVCVCVCLRCKTAT